MSTAAGPASPSSVETSRAWKTTGAATVGLAFGPSTVLLFLFGVFVGPLEREFGWSRPSILFAMTLVSLVVMVISPLQGWLIDRYGARRLALLSTVSFTVGLIAVSRIDGDLKTFYLLYGLLPWLAIGLWPVSYLRVVSTWFDRHLGLAIGIANGGIGIGAAALPLVATALMQHGGWRTAYTGVALLGLVLTLPLNWLWLKEGSTPVRQQANPLTGRTFTEVARTSSFRLLLAAFFLLGFVNTGLVANQIPLLTDAGLTPVRAALVQSVFGVAVLLGRFLCGLLLDHFPGHRLMAIVCAGGVLACGLYSLEVTNNSVFLCAVLIGAIFGAEFDVLAYLVKRYFGLAAFGRTYGAVFALFQLGASIGVAVLPLSRSRFGSYAPGLAAYMLALAAGVLLFLLLGRVSRREAAAG